MSTATLTMATANAAPPAASAHQRHQILDAATRVFLQRGYGATSMSRVAQESGGAWHTLYQQFKSKEALFGAMVERICSGFPVFDITRDEASLSDPRTGLLRLGHAVADFWVPAEAVAFLRLVIAEGPCFPALAKTFLDVGKGPAMTAVADYLAALAQRQLVTVSDPKMAARQFLGLIDQPLLWLRVAGSDETHTAAERRVIVETAVDMFLGFYRRPA